MLLMCCLSDICYCYIYFQTFHIIFIPYSESHHSYTPFCNLFYCVSRLVFLSAQVLQLFSDSACFRLNTIQVCLSCQMTDKLTLHQS